MALLVLNGCRPAPPIAKIGLLAPFEGLYRASGYAALDALRDALESCAPPEMALVPLALDSGSTPEEARRAAAKLARDPALAAVLGPLDLASAAAAADVLAQYDLPWIVPALVSPGGGYAWRPTAASIEALAKAIVQSQAQLDRLLVVGLPPAWHREARALNTGEMPLLPVESAALLDTIQSGDGVLWLGAADEAAALQNQLTAAGRTVPLWLGPTVAGAVFAAHVPQAPRVRQLIWHELNRFPDTYPLPSTYIENEATYQAACAVLAALETGTLPSRPQWELSAYWLNPDGTLAASE